MTALVLPYVSAQPPGKGLGIGQGRGMGQGRGIGQGRGGFGRAMRQAGHGNDDRHESDHEVFQFLLANHEKITRKVPQLPEGVETLTEQGQQLDDVMVFVDPAVSALTAIVNLQTDGYNYVPISGQ